ncbi:hypothetical protein K435DRAFT_866559 [Dendrothele bispora CBS 962.96]|uniref:Uncharacterized protein n=1 Tax=Dendrothele bispora (strain CBS 962.96) TaxID=1314807 RepID=A0A4S8LHT7_DENBC|nr:hypothetical protein K435DRAFT_866559 [Dendrothele bispora CBS 962.96]
MKLYYYTNVRLDQSIGDPESDPSSSDPGTTPESTEIARRGPSPDDGGSSYSEPDDLPLSDPDHLESQAPPSATTAPSTTATAESDPA